MKGPPGASLPIPGIDEDDDEEKPSIRQTLVFLRWNGKVLLLCHKKDGLITGIGGILDPGETPYDAAARYLFEFGLSCRKLRLLGLIELDINDGKKKFHVNLLTSNVFFGRPKETEDILPLWVRCTDIPYDQMPEDYSMWLPMLFQGLTFKGAFRNRHKHFISKYKLGIVYRGPERNLNKTFGGPPGYKWRELDHDDSLAIADAVNEVDPNDLNIVDQLNFDDKAVMGEEIDVLGDVNNVLL